MSAWQCLTPHPLLKQRPPSSSSANNIICKSKWVNLTIPLHPTPTLEHCKSGRGTGANYWNSALAERVFLCKPRQFVCHGVSISQRLRCLHVVTLVVLRHPTIGKVKVDTLDFTRRKLMRFVVGPPNDVNGTTLFICGTNAHDLAIQFGIPYWFNCSVQNGKLTQLRFATFCHTLFGMFNARVLRLMSDWKNRHCTDRKIA